MRIGPESGRWAQALIEQRGLQGIRVLQGFLSLTNRHTRKELERVTRIALSHEAFRLKTLRRLLKEPAEGEQTSFLETHPLIRDMGEYGAFVHAAFTDDVPDTRNHNDKRKEIT